MRNNKLRLIVFRLHLCLGLSVGLIFAALGLTGSMMVFWQSIDRWLEPKAITFETGCPLQIKQPLNGLVAVAQSKTPTEGRLTTVIFPQDERPEFRMIYQVASAIYPGEFDRYELYVDPCTAQVKGPRLWERLDKPTQGPLMAIIMRLHTGLLLSWPPNWFGSRLVGILAIVLIFSIAIGLFLWWPRRLNAWQAYTFKRQTSFARNVYDLHKLAGVYGAVLLTSLLFTGCSMYSPWHDWLKLAVQCLSPGTTANVNVVSVQQQNHDPIDASTAIQLALQIAPGWQAESLTLPSGHDGVFLVTLVSTRAVRSQQITLDQYSGEVLAWTGADKDTFGDVFLGWLFPLHTGKAFGPTGRVIVLVVGFLPTILYVTGLVRWRQKRVARVKKDNSYTTDGTIVQASGRQP